MATKKSKKKSGSSGAGKKKKSSKRKKKAKPAKKKSRSKKKKSSKKKSVKRKSRSKKKSTSKKKKSSKKKSSSKRKKKSKSKKKSTRKKKKSRSKKKKSSKSGRKSAAASALARDSSMRAAASSSQLFKKLKKDLQTIEIGGEKLWIAEGDTLLDESELKLYARQREKADEARRAADHADAGGLGTLPVGGTRGLMANTADGKITQWPAGTTLTYRVVRSSFDPASRYDKVVKNMKLAAADWEKTCGIRFEHKPELDDKSGTGPAGATFSISFRDSGGDWIALAFFPNAAPNRRMLLISTTYFRTKFYDKVGMLRHEIGHILGFRHEHIRSGAPPNCPKDAGTFTTTELTKYDPTSVMHYFCGNVGNPKLKISDLDKFSAQMVYGPPIDDSGSA